MATTNCCCSLSAFIAGVVLIKYLIKLFNGLREYAFAKSLGLSMDLKKLGPWAVVTGATDGIGKAYACELAKKGINIVLISRSQDKLDATATELGDKFKVKTKTIAADFTREDIYDDINKQLQGIEIGCLVNNVGMSYPYPEYFCDLDEKLFTDLIKCNITSVTRMTYMVLPGMKDRQRGVVINLSSGSAATPMPLLSVYSASKAYVDFFSRSLQIEYKSQGIIVQSVLPFFVTSKLSKIRRANLFVPDPTTFVKSALSTVGVESRTFGYAVHALQDFIYNLFPASFYNMIAMKQMQATRKAALKKKQKAQ